MVEAILATIAITLFAYVLGQESGSTSMALRQVIYLYIGVLLVVSPLVYWLLDDFEDDNTKVTNTNFIADLKTILKHREIWLCAICIICGYQLFYATYSFSAYLQQNFGLTAVAVGTITVAKLWMRPIGGITAGFVADWSSPEKVLSILLIAASISLGIMAFLPTNSAIIVMILVVLLIGFLTYGVRGVYWATLAGCNVPNKTKGLAIGVISMIGYFPEFYLPLISAPLLEYYPGVLGYQIYYLMISFCGLIGAYAAYLLMKPNS